MWLFWLHSELSCTFFFQCCAILYCAILTYDAYFSYWASAYALLSWLSKDNTILVVFPLRHWRNFEWASMKALCGTPSPVTWMISQANVTSHFPQGWISLWYIPVNRQLSLPKILFLEFELPSKNHRYVIREVLDSIVHCSLFDIPA